MSIPNSWTQSFPGIPPTLVGELFEHFNGQLEAWYVRDWEKVGLKAGKIAEVVLSIIQGRGQQLYPERSQKPPNFRKACDSCESAYPALSRPLRIQLPRALAAIYELRNNRAIGHTGGPVDPNAQDGEYLFRASKWCVSELSRAICDEEKSTGVASFYQAVNISELPVIWEVDDTIRILRPDLTAGDKALLVMAHFAGPISVSELQDAVEYKNSTDFKRKVLQKLHERKLCEYNRNTNSAVISPLGLRRARELAK